MTKNDWVAVNLSVRRKTKKEFEKNHQKSGMTYDELIDFFNYVLRMSGETMLALEREASGKNRMRPGKRR